MKTSRFPVKLSALLLLALFMLASLTPAKPLSAATSALDFQNAMRKLWEDHITWTRLYIISVAGDLPDQDANAQRLLQNQTDIGNAIKPYYGEDAGNQLTALLKEHILGAVDILAAAKAGDSAKLDDATKKWYANAGEIAAFLSKANPQAFPLDTMKAEMKMHLDVTLTEATARLQGKFAEDIQGYDRVHEHILGLSDTLSKGFVSQFADQFAPGPSAQETALRTAMRKLWEDHIQFTRMYIVSVAGGLPDADPTAQRLLQNQVDIGNAIKPYYGNEAGDKLTALLKDHILGAVDILSAAKAGDNAKLDAANEKWYANAAEIATFLNSANPEYWKLDALKAEMKMHLDLTLAEATAHLKGDSAGSIQGYDKVHDHILGMSDVLSSGIVAQFPDKFGGLVAAPVAAAAPAPAGKDWPNYGGDYYNRRYSSLDQINTTNVKDLKAAWKFHIGFGDKPSSFETTPVVIDGVMYITSGRNDVWALGAKNGNVKWEYHPNFQNLGEPDIKVCCGIVNRGVAVGSGKVFVARIDGQLVALDQETGKVAWQVEVGSPKDGYSETMAPQFYNGLVIIGISGAEYLTRGYVSAYDATNGKLVWRWFVVPEPGQPGSETWPAGSDIWKAGGGTMWTTPSIDSELGLVYVTTGNPGPDLDGSVRKGDNLYTDSIVALEVMTGKYRWHYQTVHHDIWDYDATSPAVLFDTTINDKPVKGLAHAGKTGFVYILDRVTGKPLVPINEKPVGQSEKQATSATQPIPEGDPFVAIDATGLDSVYKKGPIFSAFEEEPVLMLPGANGGTEWSPISYNPDTNFVYIAGINQPMIFTMHPTNIEHGTIKLGSSFVQVPGMDTSGTLTAIDVRTNKIAWQKPQKYMMIGGTTTTAGGLVFVGQGDGNFEAYDAKTGDLLWQFQTGAGANAAASVYEVDGEEYVAIASGGNFQLNFPRGDTVWVFSLKGLGPAAAPPAPATKAEAAKLSEAVNQNEVDIKDFLFAPNHIKIPAGTTVTWTETGVFPHTATANDGAFDSKTLQRGQKYSFKFDKAGTYDYFCVIHPFMIGQVEVTQ